MLEQAVPPVKSAPVENGSDILCIGICGGGKMGQSFFNYLFNFNFPVVFYIRDPQKASEVSESFQRKVKNRIGMAETVDQDMAVRFYRFKITTAINELGRADLIIEFITEDVPQKRKLLQWLAEINSNAILATGSSSIGPGRLAGRETNGNYVGLHFFYPIPFNDYVEIIVPPGFTKENLVKIQRLLNSLQKKTLILPEKVGSILNKMLLYCQNEAALLVLNHQYSPALIDELFATNLWPVGPFSFFDNIGLDIILTSLEEYTKDLKYKEVFFKLRQELAGLVGAGFLGKKTNRGFYNYIKGVKQAAIGDSPAFESEKERLEVLDRFKVLFINYTFDLFAQSDLNIWDLEKAAREFLQTDQGPVKMALTLGFGKVRNHLEQFRITYGDHYQPVALLEFLACHTVREENLDEAIREFKLEQRRRDREAGD